MIDDQYKTYSTELLRSIRLNHEKWVESKLKDKEEIPPVRIRRFKNEIPTHLPVITSGKDLFNLASNVFAGVETQCMEGGVSSPSTFKLLHISVIRSTDPSVLRINDETGDVYHSGAAVFASLHSRPSIVGPRKEKYLEEITAAYPANDVIYCHCESC